MHCACTQVRTLVAVEVFTLADLELLLITQTEERFDRNFAESGVTAAKVRTALTRRGAPTHPETAGSCAGLNASRWEQPALIVDWSKPSPQRDSSPRSITAALETPGLRARLGSPPCAPVTPPGNAASPFAAVHRFTRHLQQLQERDGEAATLKAASGSTPLPPDPPDVAYCADIVARATGYWKAKHEQSRFTDLI